MNDILPVIPPFQGPALGRRSRQNGATVLYFEENRHHACGAMSRRSLGIGRHWRCNGGGNTGDHHSTSNSTSTAHGAAALRSNCMRCANGRSEERRGGEEGRSRWWAYHLKKKKTDERSLGECSRRVQQNYKHSVPRFVVPEHESMFTLALVRFAHTATNEIQHLDGKDAWTDN